MYGTNHTRMRNCLRPVRALDSGSGSRRTVRYQRPSRHAAERAALAEQGWS